VRQGIVLLLLFFLVAPQGQHVKAQAHEEGGLALRLAELPGKVPVPMFRVSLRNVGDHDLLLNLGAMLANGRMQYLDAVHLSLTDGAGMVLPLRLRGPSIIGGRVDPMIVPLPKGAEFAFDVDLKDYAATKAHVWRLDLKPGPYRLAAEYEGVAIPSKSANSDMKGLFPVWTGLVRSGEILFLVRGR
jgi:hypothetical protein